MNISFIQFLKSKKRPASEGNSSKINNREQVLIKVSPRLMAYMVAILMLSAMFIEMNYFVSRLVEIYTVRLISAFIALIVLTLLTPEISKKHLIILVHILFLTVLISSALMVYFIPLALLLNSSIIGIMIFTAGLFLTWEIRHQITVAIYYNIVFILAVTLTYYQTLFLPFYTETILFVLGLSVVSVITSAVNLKIKKLEDERNLEIIKSEYKYRSIIDNSLEGIFQSTIDGKWLTLNKSFAHILGFDDRDELMKMAVKEIYADEKDRLLLINELERNRQVQNYRIKLKRKDGTIAIVRLNDRIVKDETGNTYLEGNIYDITDQVKAEEERNEVEHMLKIEKEKTEKLAQEAIRISGTKSKFLANLSHEIRTPMNGILGFLTLIEAGAYSNDDELKMFSTNARQSAESLLDIINSILDLSKIEAGKIKIENVSFNLLHVIDQSISVVLVKANEKKVSIIKDIQKNTEIMLVGDMIKLRQILINLLNNAVKFTSDGEIIIKINTIVENSDEVELQISVSDTGMGIPESKLKDLFKPYFQVGGFHENFARGTGLGLVICKEFVELLGGKISVMSKEGEGSTFNFTINCKVQTELESLDKNSNKKQSFENHSLLDTNNVDGNGYKTKREKFNLILAEDNLINQKVIIKILNAFGFNVSAVKDGQEVINAVSEGDYDLILMDLQMPNVDGFSATEKIRSLPNTKKNIPIIALTAHALIGDKEKCLEAGMTDYVSKPISGKDLVNKIDILLDIRNDDKVRVEASTKKKSSLLDRDRLKNMSLGDNDFEKDLLISYLSDLDEKINKLNEYVASNNIKKIVELAHSIKGSSYSIGADRAGDEAFAIELSGKNNDWYNVSERIEKFNFVFNETRYQIENYLNKNKKPSAGGL